jgi:hypothetical protein
LHFGADSAKHRANSRQLLSDRRGFPARTSETGRFDLFRMVFELAAIDLAAFMEEVPLAGWQLEQGE